MSRTLLAVTLLLSFCAQGAEPQSDVESLMADLDRSLGTESPCPVGEATDLPEWKGCLNRWERMKTEELYQTASGKKREVASEPEAPAEAGH